MPHEPKKRHSRQRQGKRRAAIKLFVAKGILCPNCANLTFAHTVCKHCGFYKGRDVLKKRSAQEKQAIEEANEKPS